MIQLRHQPRASAGARIHRDVDAALKTAQNIGLRGEPISVENSMNENLNLKEAKRSFKVNVDDNFHYMNVDERYALGEFPSLEEAIVACKKIVDEFLEENHKPAMSAAALFDNYKAFGEDPWIAGADVKVPFSAWSYAERRCAEICARDAEAGGHCDGH